jgi:putative transposase
MPRAARLVVPDVALHLVQRGNNRSQCFFAEADYARYLRYLARFAAEFGCSVHAYCLMTNHVHLLLTPHEQGACARAMKQLNQCYVQSINRLAGRTGTLWEGRFHTGLVLSGHYALACYRYIELNPVRAGLVVHPREYRWSSYEANAESKPDLLVSPHAAYLALGEEAGQRTRAYRHLFDSGMPEAAADDIRKATRGGYAIGTHRRSRGRPTKKWGTSLFKRKTGTSA